MKSKEIISQIFSSAGITINGSQPWDITVNDERFYDRVVADGTLGVGEAYMDGWWDCDALDEMIARIVRVGSEKPISKTFHTALHVLKSKLFNLQNKTGSKKVAEKHYDLGNDLYTAFLDKNMQYSCGYFKDTMDLDQAQKQKLDLICKKLQLQPGDHVLDIGCGWGGLSKWMAEKYGCRVTGISISQEQVKYAQKWTEGLPVQIINMDYRDIEGTFDKVVSVGMFEHVGYKNYSTMIGVVKKVLKPDGLFLLHTIGRDESGSGVDPWIEKYIFPNGMLPSEAQIVRASEKNFIMEDWHNIGAYYDPTLMAWWKNFDKAWPKFKEEYGDRFYRMFRYYLLSCAGAFRARDIELWQIVFSPKGVLGGYESVR